MIILVEHIPEGKFTETEGPEGPSKSQRKRDALEVRALASRLIELPPAKLEQLPLADAVRSAIGEARRIRSRVARKRQMQYVAKLLRREDPDSLFDALDALDADARQSAARQHRVEAWRDRLLERGDAAVTELMVLRPGADAQLIRQHLRNAAREAAAQRPPSSARALFRLLRELDSEEPLRSPGSP